MQTSVGPFQHKDHAVTQIVAYRLIKRSSQRIGRRATDPSPFPDPPLEGNASSLPPKHHDILMKRKRQSVSLHTRDAGYLHVPIAQILTTASPPCYRFVAIPRSPLEGNAPSLPPKHRAPSPNWAVARACNARPSCGCRIESMLSGRLSFAARFPESVWRDRWFRRDR